MKNYNDNFKIWASIVAVIGLIASIAQISGFSIKDFLKNDVISNTRLDSISTKENKMYDEAVPANKTETELPQAKQSSLNKNNVKIEVRDNGKVGTIINGDSNKIDIKQDF